MLLWLRKPHESINTPGCGWAAEIKKGFESVPDPFNAGAYTASDNALHQKSGLVHETTGCGSLMPDCNHARFALKVY